MKKNAEINLIKNKFEEEYNDNTLQICFNSFLLKEKHLIEENQEIIAKSEIILKKINDLEKVIILSACNNIIATEACISLKELTVEYEKLLERNQKLINELQKEQTLISNYKIFTEKKLFQYWQTFRTLDSETEPWLTWKIPYTKIF